MAGKGSCGFTPLHPESPSFQSGDEWHIKIKSLRKPRPVTKKVCNGTRLLKWGVTGFTLVEALMVTGLFALIIGLILSVFLTGNLAWGTGSAKLDIQLQARQGLNTMIEELNLSQYIKVKIIDAHTLTLQVPLTAASLGQDGRSTVELDDGGNVVWGAAANPGYWIEYVVANNQLRRKIFNNRPDQGGVEQTGLETTLAQDIQSVDFVADQVSSDPSWPQGVEITLTAAKANATCALTTMVFFKN